MRLSEKLLQNVVRRLAKRSLPRLPEKGREEIVVPTIHRPVRVQWEKNGIPHITAEREDDLCFAQGYLHARERLFQMDFTRHLVQGRVSELLGDRPVDWSEFSIRFKGIRNIDLDHFMRTLSLARAARESEKTISFEIRSLLAAYARGVNAFIEQNPKRLPFEYRLLSAEPAPWSVEDSLCATKAMCFQLSLSWRTALALDELAARSPLERNELEQLLPAYPIDAPRTTRLAREGTRPGPAASGERFLGWGGAPAGSNAWVLSGKRTQSGAPILCSDPHLLLLAPPIWYLMHLRAPGLDVIGSTLPGNPGVVIGRNRYIAWGLTNVMLDDADIYIEKTDPRSPDRYRVNGEWRDMEIVEEEYQIKGKRSERRKIRYTRHGPILSDAVGARERENEVLSMRWTALEPSHEVETIRGICRATNWGEFLDAVRLFCSPAQNIVYGDVYGNIGYYLMGEVPIRKGKGNPVMPLPGWNDENEWQGYVPFEERPHLFNPEEGFIANANDAVAGENYPCYISHLWEPPYRISRIREVIKAKKRHSREDMRALQSDVFSVRGSDFVRDVIRPLKSRGRELPEKIKAAVECLLDWDGELSAESTGAAIYEALVNRLLQALFRDRMGEDLYLAYAELQNQSVVPLDQIIRDADSPWMKAAGGRDLITRALEDAIEWLRRTLGDDPSEWRWGRLHTLEMRHFLGAVPALAPLVNIGPVETGGDGLTVNMGFFFHSRPFANVLGPSYRQVIDLGDLDRSAWIMPAGQSGNPLSEHYSSLMPLWQTGEYLPMQTDASDLASAPETLLIPG